MLTAERLREVLDYDPESGVFIWRVKPCRGVRTGVTAGCARPAAHKRAGERRIKVDGRQYHANVLAFLYMTGRFAVGDVDHRDKDPGNNRWDNLRESTRSENIANSRLRANKSGFPGVSFCRPAANRLNKPWRARMRVQGKFVCLGYYATGEEAHGAYLKAARQAFGEFARS